ncbi:MAG: transcription elongation factor GreA [Deltaproteobacteria bacterium CG_4_10_14_0_2_um_filter_43_8]|nr:MAG: transcription elongation factor GreA [Deltaproteobacteria bacterium CG11_big_fil_rev_8_21_14_0_20_42_23]PJA19068.1 MAG: transcription elongation factor GreA [Deltaproteobacteria bacterium CG_4_10_14_0_2_um_filter_43_8]PJC64175.1 MAG: transcription elongation factor GreA [Deltaproteobacteria bacterium CG_4_9_14_0_2_um_filter_42_21]
MTDRVPLTPQGYKTLQERLKHLKGVERPRNIAAIEEARSHGDLSENAEYDAAKEEQGMINSQIVDLEAKIALAEIIDPSKIDSDKIVFGATVKLIDLDTDEESTYQIVGTPEADLNHGKISIESPMARALIGKSEGDEARVKTPKGIREVEILKVEFK